MLRLILLLILLIALVSVVGAAATAVSKASDALTPRQTEERAMPKFMTKVAYIGLLILMFSAAAGSLGGF